MIKPKMPCWKMLMSSIKTIAAAVKGGNVTSVGISSSSIKFIVCKETEASEKKLLFLRCNRKTATVCSLVNNEDIVLAAKKIFRTHRKENDITASATSDLGESENLTKITSHSSSKNIKLAKVSNRISNISFAIQEYAENLGFYVIHDRLNMRWKRVCT